MKVAWNLRQDSVAVAVSDGGGHTVPLMNQPSNWSLGGRGLGIVDRLSLRWGVCAGDDHGNAGLDGGGPHDGHGYDAAPRACPADRAPGEITVWAELPVRYGTSASLVIASSRDA